MRAGARCLPPWLLCNTSWCLLQLVSQHCNIAKNKQKQMVWSNRTFAFEHKITVRWVYFECLKYCSDDFDKALHWEIARRAGSQALLRPSPFTLLALSYFGHQACTWLCTKKVLIPKWWAWFRQKYFVFLLPGYFSPNWLVTYSWNNIFTFHMSSEEWWQKDSLPNRMLCILSIHSWHKPSSSQSNTNAFSLHLCFLDLFIE